MKIVLILLLILVFIACSDIISPADSIETFKGNWKSESITIISRNGITINNLPDNYHISLVLNNNMTFELIRKADNFLVSDTGNWELNHYKDSLELFCENGVKYSLRYDSSETKLKYHSSEFIEMEILEINAILIKSK